MYIDCAEELEIQIISRAKTGVLIGEREGVAFIYLGSAQITSFEINSTSEII